MMNFIDPIRKKNKQTTIMIAISSVAVIIIIVCLFFIIRDRNISVFSNKKYNTKEVESLEANSNQQLLDDIRTKLSAGNSVASVLRDYYPDKVVYSDYGKYVFADINDSLKKNTYSQDGFKKDSKGVITYSDQNISTTFKGIDLSKYQGDVDFAKVKQDQVDYAMIRCGNRSYGSGVITDDTYFDTYVTDALSNGIKAGVYFFSQAVTKDEALEEADFVLDKIRPYNITYPVVIDVEEIYNDTFRQQNLSNQELTDIVITFCERIKSQGYTPMIYANLKYFVGKLDMTRLESYEKWFAYYDDTPYFPYEFSMWQYSEKGSVNGVTGDVDLNIGFKDLSKK